MEQYSNAFKGNLVANTKTVVLDYLFGEGDEMDAYQLVRFAEGEAWNILSDGFLLGSLNKIDNFWIADNAVGLDGERICSIGKFIDSQHFNRLPGKIIEHWAEFVDRVIMQTDSEYLIVTLPEIDFESFQRLFTSFATELVEDPWPIEFKVYNAEFDKDFIVRVL